MGINQFKIKMLCFHTCLLFPLLSFAQTTIKLSGKIFDQANNCPIESVYIFLNDNKSIGYSEADGSFNVNLSDSSSNQIISFHHISYQTQKRSFKEIMGSDDIQILMLPDYKEIKEVHVTPINVNKLVKRALLVHNRNSSIIPYCSKAYYYDWTKYNNKFVALTESYGYYLNPGMYGDVPPWRLSYFISDNYRVTNQLQFYTESMKLEQTKIVSNNGITTTKRFLPFSNISIEYRALERKGPLNPKYHKYYNFSLDSIFFQGHRMTYKVAFKTKNNSFSEKFPVTCSGSLIIDDESCSITELNVVDLNYLHIWHQIPRPKDLKPDYLSSTTVRFRNTKGKITIASIQHTRKWKRYITDLTLDSTKKWIENRIIRDFNIEDYQEITTEETTILNKSPGFINDNYREISLNSACPWIKYDSSKWEKDKFKIPELVKIRKYLGTNSLLEDQFRENSNNLFYLTSSKKINSLYKENSYTSQKLIEKIEKLYEKD